MKEKDLFLDVRCVRCFLGRCSSALRGSRWLRSNRRDAGPKIAHKACTYDTVCRCTDATLISSYRIAGDPGDLTIDAASEKAEPAKISFDFDKICP
jgi:hypothetical protein